MDFKKAVYAELNREIKKAVEAELEPTIAEANRRIANFECPVHGPGQTARATVSANFDCDSNEGKAIIQVRTCCEEGEKAAEVLVADLFKSDEVTNSI